MPKIMVTTIVSARDGSPRVEIDLGKNRTKVQLSVDEARDLALNILGGAESAVQDAFIVDWVRTRIKGDDRTAAGLLEDFRHMRRDRQNDESA